MSFYIFITLRKQHLKRKLFVVHTHINMHIDICILCRLYYTTILLRYTMYNHNIGLVIHSLPIECLNIV